MTDDTPRSELVSAYLDGEATPAERARVEGDPSLVARVEELRALRSELLAEPPPGLIDDHVSAAMAEFDERPHSGVTDLAERRRRPLHERIPLGAVAAAVVVLALFGALTQVDLGSDDETTTATASDTASGDAGFEEAGEALDGQTSDDAAEAPADAGAGSTFGGDAPEAIGGAAESGYSLEFTDTDALADHILQNYGQITDSAAVEQDSDHSTGAAAERALDPCDAAATAGVDSDAVTVVLPAVVDGDPVTAIVVDTGTGTGTEGRRLVVVDDTDCSVIVDRPL